MSQIYNKISGKELEKFQPQIGWGALIFFMARLAAEKKLRQ